MRWCQIRISEDDEPTFCYMMNALSIKSSGPQKNVSAIFDEAHMVTSIEPNLPIAISGKKNKAGQTTACFIYDG